MAVKTLLALGPDGVDNEDGGEQDALLAETAAEAEALSKLRHANMMHFFGICFLPEQQAVAMVTELCTTDLRSWIDEHASSDPSQVSA